MMSETKAGYRSKAPAASIVLRTNRKLGSDYCGSRKSKPTASPTSSNFPLVLKSILKTNNKTELSQETDPKLPLRPVKVVSSFLISIYLQQKINWLILGLNKV